MRLSITIAGITLLASSSLFAAKVETCFDEVARKCSVNHIRQALRAVDGNQCSIVQEGQREDGTTYAQKVIFKDSNSVYSIELDKCRTNRVNIAGKFKEQKQYKGRLFSLTADGRVVVVGRDNSILLLLNSKNQPYRSVSDIKVGETLTLTFENGQKHQIGAAEVLKKLNHSAAKFY